MAGTSTLALYFAGASSTVQNLATTEEYDGSSWAEAGDLSTGRKFPGSDGTQTLALGAGGYTPGPPYPTNATEEWTKAVAAVTFTSS